MGKARSGFLFCKRYAENFKKLRKKYGMTQAEFAKEVYYSDKMIAAIEMGTRYPSPELLCEVANRFNVGLDFLTGRTDAMEAEVQSITDVIGLSEKSVERLSEMESNLYDTQHLLKVIDILINNERLLDMLNDYLFAPEQIYEVFKGEPVSALEFGNTLVTSERLRKIILFEIQEELSKMRKEIADAQ